MKRAYAVLMAAVLGGALLDGPIRAQVLPPAPPSLKTVPVPEPSNLALFVRDKPAAIALGKALFGVLPPRRHRDQVVAVRLLPAGAGWPRDGRPRALRYPAGPLQEHR